VRSPGEAARTILQDLQPLATERVALLDALGCVLAEDVRSPLDLPPWDNSAMDGYAVRGADFGSAGGAAAPRAAVELRVVETIPAGGFPTRPLGPGECARIFTGAPLPQGADAVIRQEDTTRLAGDRVRIDDARDVGHNLRRRGEDIRRDSVPLARGTPLGPAQLGVLASLGMAEVPVHRRPRVAILGSGNEIADLDESAAIRAGRKIASSNTYTLLASLRQAGVTAANLGIARDDAADIARRVRTAGDADLLVTTAGISVGEHDQMRQVLEDTGGSLTFWRIRMRPGAPVGYGRLGGVPWIGLPGNPVSTMVTFELFVRPAIRKLLGYRTFFRRTVPVRVAEPLRYPARLTHFLRAVVVEEDGERVARLTGPQGSGILTSMAQANALLILPAEQDDVAAGDGLDAILLDEPVHLADPPFE
jgi:molybdopterin molybdotransferase